MLDKLRNGCYDKYLEASFAQLFGLAILLWLSFSVIFCYFSLIKESSYSEPSQSGQQVSKCEEIDFSESMYFSAVTLTTLGYGDFQPRGAGRFFAALEAVLGLMLFGVMVAKLANDPAARLRAMEKRYGGVWICRTKKNDQLYCYSYINIVADKECMGLKIIGRDWDCSGSWLRDRYETKFSKKSEKGVDSLIFQYHNTSDDKFPFGEMIFHFCEQLVSFAGTITNQKSSVDSSEEFKVMGKKEKKGLAFDIAAKEPNNGTIQNFQALF